MAPVTAALYRPRRTATGGDVAPRGRGRPPATGEDTAPAAGVPVIRRRAPRAGRGSRTAHARPRGRRRGGAHRGDGVGSPGCRWCRGDGPGHPLRDDRHRSGDHDIDDGSERHVRGGASAGMAGATWAVNVMPPSTGPFPPDDHVRSARPTGSGVRASGPEGHVGPVVAGHRGPIDEVHSAPRSIRVDGSASPVSSRD